VGERDALIEGLLVGVGISESAPADVLGYSLGGAILGRMLRRPSFSRMVRRRVLLAPGFLQVLTTASSSHSLLWPLLAQVSHHSFIVPLFALAAACTSVHISTNVSSILA
jgi:hypothetical protein